MTARVSEGWVFVVRVDEAGASSTRRVTARFPTSACSFFPVQHIPYTLCSHLICTMTIDLQAQPAPDESSAAVYRPPSISHLDNVVYLVGHPIAHSSSPKLHDSISKSCGITYAQCLAETTDLPSFLEYLRSSHPQVPRSLGTGVTMPHKVTVLDHLDHLTPEAKAIGAVNTIFFKGQEWWGTNTDTIGIRDAFTLNLREDVLKGCRGRPGLVVGGGGTCRTAIYTLQRMMGCGTVYIINRDPEEVEAVLQACGNARGKGEVIHISTVEEARDLEAPGLVVSAIPDFTPSTPAEQLVRDILETLLIKGKENGGALLEMCYHPSPDTQITQLAGRCGWRVIGGLEAMMAQGLEQAKLWTGIEVDEKLRRDAREAVMSKVE